MRGCEIDARCHPGFECFRPASHAKTPPIARLQAGKIPFRRRRGEVISTAPGEFQKFRRHLHADGMKARVARPRFAIAIPVKAGHGRLAAALKVSSEHIGLHARPIADRAIRAKPFPLRMQKKGGRIPAARPGELAGYFIAHRFRG